MKFYFNITILLIIFQYKVQGQKLDFVIKPSKNYVGAFILHGEQIHYHSTSSNFYFHMDGSPLIKKFDRLSYEFGPSGNEVISVIINKKIGVYNLMGEQVLPPIYDDLYTFEGEAIAVMNDQKKLGIVDRSGEILVPFNFTQVKYLGKSKICYDFSNGLCIVNDQPGDSKRSIITDKSGKSLVTVDAKLRDYTKFDDFSIFEFEGGTAYQFNNTSRKFLPFQGYIQNFYSTNYHCLGDSCYIVGKDLTKINNYLVDSTKSRQFRKTSKGWLLYEDNGILISSKHYKMVSKLENNSNHLTVALNFSGTFDLVDSNGKILISECYIKPYDVEKKWLNGYFEFYLSDGTFGIANANGIIINSPPSKKLRLVEIISDNRMLVVNADEPYKLGIYDFAWKPVVPIGKYNSAEHIGSGFVRVGTNDKFGLIDSNGNQIISNSYNGLAHSSGEVSKLGMLMRGLRNEMGGSPGKYIFNLGTEREIVNIVDDIVVVAKVVSEKSIMWSLINIKSGKEIFSLECNGIKYLGKGLAQVKFADNTGSGVIKVPL